MKRDVKNIVDVNLDVVNEIVINVANDDASFSNDVTVGTNSDWVPNAT